MKSASSRPRSHLSKPVALVVFLENVGHIAGLDLPAWVKNAIDWTTEEYAKLLLHVLGAYRRYDRVVILEDERANGSELVNALLFYSSSHTLDLLLLVHGLPYALVGHRGQCHVNAEHFEPMVAACRQTPSLIDLRMVYGLNCYGASLGPTWLDLGAQVANGAVGVNWLPEPSLSVFLRKWLGGAPYSEAVDASFRWGTRAGRLIWPDREDGPDQHIQSSRQVIFGRQDITIDS